MMYVIFEYVLYEVSDVEFVSLFVSELFFLSNNIVYILQMLKREIVVIFEVVYEVNNMVMDQVRKENMIILRFRFYFFLDYDKWIMGIKVLSYFIKVLGL